MDFTDASRRAEAFFVRRVVTLFQFSLSYHTIGLSQQYYQVNKVGNLMSLYTNDLDTIQECFGDGVLMFFDALTLGLLALYKMWTMDVRLTLPDSHLCSDRIPKLASAG